MNITSPWLPVVKNVLRHEPVFERKFKDYSISLRSVDDTLWVITECGGAICVLLRSAYTATGNLQVLKTLPNDDGIQVHVKAPIGGFSVDFKFLESIQLLFRCTTTFTPSKSLY